MVAKKKASILRVIDGDTVEVKYGNNKKAHVRLIGVNTPESHPSPHKHVEPFGKEAQDFTTETLYVGRKIFIETDKDLIDMYGRTLGYIWLDEETLFNKLLVDKGFAKVYTWKPNVKYEQMFIDAETVAFEQKIGIWVNSYFTRDHKVH